MPLDSTFSLPDRFNVHEVLGAGQMGVVLRAHDLVTGEMVAVKLIHPKHLGDSEILDRFERECDALGRLDSEHVQRLLFAGTTHASQPFAVFELLVGQSLGEALRAESAATVATCVARLRQAASGIAAAHAAGIVHRDVKPSNLFLHRDDLGAPEVVKVVDFGIAKLPLAARRKATGEAAFLGTPTYMAPEQIRSSQVGPSADVWSLGTVLYETLAGHPPFRRASAVETLEAVLTAEPPCLPPEREVPSDVSEIVSRCLQKHAADRFADGARLVEALEGALARM